MKITDLNGYWFKANKETFDILLKAGYKTFTENTKWLAIKKEGRFRIDDNGTFFSETEPYFLNDKQAYHHNGEFYTIDGEWLVDEDGFVEVARIPITEEEEKAILNNANKWQDISGYIDSRPAEQKEGARIALEYVKPIVEAASAGELCGKSIQELITGEMLSEVLGENVVITTSGRIAFHANGFRVVEAELKDKLEEWICKNTLSYDIGFDVSDKMWTMEIWWGSDPYNKCMGWESESKLEALLKLYHAIKGVKL